MIVRKHNKDKNKINFWDACAYVHEARTLNIIGIVIKNNIALYITLYA